jgi:hypothetical protein
VEQARQGGITAELGDARNLRFASGSFDDWVRALREAARVVRPVVELLGVEGLAGWLPQLEQRWQDAADRELIVWSARLVEAETSLRGLSAHLLAVAHPRDRTR